MLNNKIIGVPKVPSDRNVRETGSKLENSLTVKTKMAEYIFTG